MDVLCKGSVKKLALGQCVRNQASQHWEQSVGQQRAGKGQRGRAVTFKPFIASRSKFN